MSENTLCAVGSDPVKPAPPEQPRQDADGKPCLPPAPAAAARPSGSPTFDANLKAIQQFLASL